MVMDTDSWSIPFFEIDGYARFVCLCVSSDMFSHGKQNKTKFRTWRIHRETNQRVTRLSLHNIQSLFARKKLGDHCQNAAP